MCKYKKWTWVKQMYLEGNNGGDYIEIEQSDKPGTILLTVGHSCVITVQRREVPIELITSLFSELSLGGDSVKEMMRQLWPTPHGKELADKIMPYVAQETE